MLLLALSITTAFADESLPNPSTPEALAQLEEGNKLYTVRDYEKAIAAYKQGVRLEPKATVTFWYNLGQAHRQWGKYDEAIWFYSQFLKQAPAKLALHRQAAEGFIEKMQSELDRPASTASPTEPGPTPLHDSAPQPVNRDAAPTNDAHAEGRQSRWYQDRLGWVLAGVGAAGVGAGAALLLNGRSLQDQANREPISSERQQLRDDSSARTTAGVLVGGVGVAVLAAGTLKLLLTPGRDVTHSAISITIAPRWVGLQGRF